ncbi:hypothetical protein AGMMS50218_12510 [Actinomycetota bacterium]|nr:hypothetical protein AGMMS50218_12510 [Actinomycetota bacterium]
MTDDVVQAVRTRFDGRAPSYDASAMHRELADAVAAFVDPSAVTAVLDVATGTGLVLRALRDRCGPVVPRMVGVDISPGMLAVARDALPDAELVEADARQLPLPDASVDLVTCVTGLHLIPDTPMVVSEWARVLRPGGTVVTATFATFDASRHHRELAGDTAPAPYPLRHAEFSTPQAIQGVMAADGFRLLRHETWTDGYDTVLIAELVRG